MDGINTSKRGNRDKSKKRGIVGIEAAIVLIAFVIVAAALAFVVLNMGFASTQKAKETIANTMGASGSAVEVEAALSGANSVTNATLNTISVPIRISAGSHSIDFGNSTMAVRFVSTGPNTNVIYSNIYNGTLSSGEYRDTPTAVAAKGSSIHKSNAFIYWSQNVNNNNVLDPGEHAVMVLNLAPNDRPKALDTFTVEILTPTGAVMTVSRQVQTITTAVVDLS